MVKNILVTTGLKKTFPKKITKNFIFLGKWCYLGVNQEVYIKNIFHKYHWDDREKLFNDYNYLNDLYERLLPVLSNKLNSLNNVNYSIEYWRILIGPWLGYFTQIFYDRYETIKSLENANIRIDETNLIKFNEKDIIPLGMQEFIGFFIDDPWNHYIFGYIISHISSIKINYINSTKFKLNINKFIKIFYVNLKLLFNFKLKVVNKEANQVFFLSTYLSKKQESFLLNNLNNNDIKWEKISINVDKPKNLNRNWNVDFETNSEFENLLVKIIPKQIPFLYLEQYNFLTKTVNNSDWPKNPRTIFTSNAFESDDCFKHYTGLNKLNQTKIVIGQHGGHYGTGKWNFSEEHELKISDTYLSWGWKNKNNNNIFPIGKIKFQNKILFNQCKQTILLINVVLPRYSYQMYSVFVSSQYLYYLQNQFDFVDNINDSIRKNLRIRLFPSKITKWLQKERWLAYNPNLKFDSCKNINNSYADAKLVVVTFNATVFLETFNLNIPTVIFWDPNFWEIRDCAIEFYNSLIKVGVLHYDSISASKHVNKIWDNVEDWWNSNDVQNAVLNFKNKYAKCNENVMNDLLTVLN